MCPGTLFCGGPLPIQQEIALWGGIVGAGLLSGGGAAVATGSVGVTAGASTLGEGLTLIGARFQGVIDFFRNLGAGLTDSPTVKQPISDDFERAFSTQKGSVGIMADAVTEGTTLTLKNAAVYGDKEKVQLGVSTVLSLTRQLGAELQGKGYKTLIVEGLRYSGAKSGKTQTLFVNLTKLRK